MPDAHELLALLLEPTVRETLEQGVAGLSGDLGAGSSRLPFESRLDGRAGSAIALFDQPVQVRGAVALRGGFQGVDSPVDPFGTGELAPLRSGHNTGVLTLTAGIDLASELGFAPAAGLQLSARAGASRNLLYQHTVAAPPTWSRSRAFGQLLAGSRLPNLLDLREPPAIGETHRLETDLALDFGLQASAGYELAQETALDLADGLSAAYRSRVAATLRAAIGLGLFERFRLTVGRAAQLEEGWIRIRMERAAERHLTLGVTFALDLHYDLGSGLRQLLEEALDGAPTARLVTGARQIARYTDLDTLREEASEELLELVDDLVTEGIVGGLGQVLSFARRVVTAYDSLDERVQSLWERVLATADLGPGSRTREWLERLRALGAADDELRALLAGGGEHAELLLAVEAISGRSLEHLLLDETGLADSLADTSRVAAEALDFLDGESGEIVGRMRAFAERTGIDAVVETLRGIDDLPTLRARLSGRLGRLAGRIVGKAVDSFDAGDLAKLHAWAERVVPLLDPDDPGGLQQRISSQLERIRLDYGLSIGFEIDRVSRSTAILDLEVSHRGAHRKLRRRIGDAIGSGRPRAVLEVLADAAGMIERSPDDGISSAEPADAPFLVRECVFSSERIRTSAVSVLFDLAGLGKLLGADERGFTRVSESSTLRVVDRRVADPTVAAGAPDRFERHARYAAGYVRGDRTADLDSEAAVWLVTQESGFGLERDAAFTGERSTCLRLACSFEDPHARLDELEALYTLLGQLGFAPLADGPATASELAAASRQVKLACELELGRAAVAGVLDGLAGGGGEDAWRRAYLDACFRWYQEGLVSRSRVAVTGNTRNLGQVMARILADAPADLRGELESGTVGGFFSAFGGRGLTVAFGSGDPVSFPIGAANDPTELTGPLWALIHRRAAGYRAFAGKDRLADAWREAADERSPAAYARLLRQFARAHRAAAQRSLRWPSSLFGLWLWLANLSFHAPGALASARGVAVLRWRTAGPDQDNTEPAPWGEPMLWHLPAGVPNHLGRLSVFPFA